MAVQTKRFNIPMALTWARIAFIPLIVGVFYVPDWIAGPHVKNLLACVMFVIAAVTDALDGYIARIVAAVKEAGMYDDTIFIITSDHGGIKKGHGGKTMAEMQTPFIIAGKNIKKAGEFQESMVQYDVAATMAYIFGLEQPQVWTGRAMKQVFK